MFHKVSFSLEARWHDDELFHYGHTHNIQGTITINISQVGLSCWAGLGAKGARSPISWTITPLQSLADPEQCKLSCDTFLTNIPHNPFFQHQYFKMTSRTQLGFCLVSQSLVYITKLLLKHLINISNH